MATFASNTMDFRSGHQPAMWNRAKMVYGHSGVTNRDNGRKTSDAGPADMWCFYVKVIQINASFWLVSLQRRRQIATPHRGGTAGTSNSDVSVARGSRTAVERANNGPWNTGRTFFIIVTIHWLSLLCSLVVVCTVPDVNQLVVARIFAAVHLAMPTCSRATSHCDHHADDDDGKGTQHRSAYQRRNHRRVQHQTSDRHPTTWSWAKMVLGHVAVDDGRAQSDAGRQRLSTGVGRSDCYNVRCVDVAWCHGCDQSNFARIVVDAEPTVDDRWVTSGFDAVCNLSVASAVGVHRSNLQVRDTRDKAITRTDSIFIARCYRQRGLCRRKVRPFARLSVCLHTPVFCRNGYTYTQTFFHYCPVTPF